jgi:hypothetical protein
VQRQLGNHVFYHLRGAERLLAANAMEWLRFVEYRRLFAASVNSRRGASVIASSGQVFSHNPHCTQLVSMKRSCGMFGLSASAASGTGADARHAQRARLLVHHSPCRTVHRPVARFRPRASARVFQMIDCQCQCAALVCRDIEQGMLRNGTCAGRITANATSSCIGSFASINARCVPS